MWYHNAKTGQIGIYKASELTKLFRTHSKGLTIGFESKDEAVEWSKKWGYCAKCEAVRKGKICVLCRSEIVYTDNGVGYCYGNPPDVDVKTPS